MRLPLPSPATLAGIAALALLLAPSTASASTAAIDDPADATPTVSGQPSSPDVARVEITYDPAGSASLTARFHNAFDSLDTSQNYAFYARFTLGHVERATKGYACSTTAQGDQDGQHHVFASTGITFYDQATVTGFDGKLQYQRTTADDKRSVTVTASSGSIAHRDYSCATYELRHRRRGAPSHPDTRYDEFCDCWYFDQSADQVGEPGATNAKPIVYFDGRRPPPLPACDNNVDDDGDGWTDSEYDKGCASRDDDSEVNEACANGLDDDGDGGIDYLGHYPSDSGCTSHGDTTEFDPDAPACSNSRDDDGDGKSDSADEGCSSTTDVDERTTVCENRVDEDADGRIDDKDRDAPDLGTNGCDVTPRLLPPQGKRALRRELARRYVSFRRGRSRRIDRCRSVSATRVTCRVGWTYRKRVYRGRATVRVASGRQRFDVRVRAAAKK